MSCANKHDNEGVHLGRDAASIKSQRAEKKRGGGGGRVRHIWICSYFPSDSHLCFFLFHLPELCFSFFCSCNSLEARSVTLGSSKSPDLSKRHREGEMGIWEGGLWECVGEETVWRGWSRKQEN